MQWGGTRLGIVVIFSCGCAAPVDRFGIQSRPDGATPCRQPAHPSSDSEPARGSPIRSLTYGEREALEVVGREVASSVVEVRAVSYATAPGIFPNGSTDETSRRSRGTGIVIGRDGLILTNEHVVRDAEEVIVTLPDGSQYRAEHLAVGRHTDLAILRINERSLHALSLLPVTIEQGTAVIAVTSGRHRAPRRFQMGVVTVSKASLQEELDPNGWRSYDGLVESTVRLEPGYSGGPLLDVGGRLIGLNVAVSEEATPDSTRGFTIPFNRQTLEVINQLVDQVAFRRLQRWALQAFE